MIIDQQRISAGVEQIPMLPTSVAQVSRLARDPRSDARAFERALRPDPGLTANLLRLANSPYFGAAGEIGSVRQAVAYLGTKRVVEAAMAGAFTAVLPRTLAGYGIDSATFWRHSVAVAVLGERISRELKIGSPDVAFTGGLLHDIGKLVTSAWVAEQVDEVLDTLGEGSFVEAERTVLGVDHTVVGEAVAQRWGLPLELRECIRWHHDPDRSEHRVVDVVHVANGMAHAVGLGADVGELSRRVARGAMERLNAPARSLERLLGDALDAIEQLVAAHVGNGVH